MLEYVLIVAGLSLFEVINSIRNAIINSEVLSTMSERSRRWFLFWGILIAVFVVRGILPIMILSSFEEERGAHYFDATWKCNYPLWICRPFVQEERLCVYTLGAHTHERCCGLGW